MLVRWQSLGLDVVPVDLLIVQYLGFNRYLIKVVDPHLCFHDWRLRGRRIIKWIYLLLDYKLRVQHRVIFPVGDDGHLLYGRNILALPGTTFDLRLFLFSIE